jgi:hypothetical protein
MVYRAQGTSDVWIIAKLTLFALPLIALLVPLILWQSGQRMASLILLLFAVAFATDAHMHSLLSGLMDGPMALMALAFAGWAVVTVYSVDRHENSSNLVLLATLAGICAVTKQAGFLVLPTFYSILILFFVHRKINPWTAIVSATVAAIPLALFGAIFISVSRQPFGNLSYLSDLAWKDRGYWTQLLYSGQLLEAEVSSSVLFILCASSLLNFFNMRRLPGQVGVIFLVFASVGFVVFANCCSYEARNGWWVISLLAGSAAFGCTIIYQGKMSYCWTSIPALAVPISLLFVAISTAALVGASYSDRSLNSVQSAEQWRSVSPGLSKLLKEQKDRFVSGAVLISPDRPVGWLPGLRDHYTACSFDRPDCIIDAVSSADTAYILISDIPVLDYAYLRPILPPELLIGVADGFSLYGPVTKPMLHGLAGRYVSDGQLSERQAPPN